MFADVFLFLSIYLCFLSLLFLSGFSFLQLFKTTFLLKGLYTKTFASLLFGLVIVVTCFAAFKTHFLTVTLFFPLLLFFAFYGRSIHMPAKEDNADKKSLKFILPVIFLVLLPFIYFALLVFKTGDFHFKALEYDNAVYGHLSSYLADTGIENKWFSYFTDHSTIASVEPYHYVECWLNAAVISVFGTNSLISFYLVTYPLLILISSFGILSIIEHYKRVKFPDVILSFLLLFVGAVFSVKQSNYHFNTLAAEVPLQHYGEKFSVYYPFILFAFLLLINNLKQEALLFGLSLCIVSSTLFPAIFMFSILTILFFFKSISKTVFSKMFIFLFAFAAFYKLFASGDRTYTDTWRLYEFSDLGTFSCSLTWFKLAISNFIYGFIKSALYFMGNYFYLPFLVIALRREALKPVLYPVMVCFCGLFISCFFYRMLDNYQLFTNTLPVLHVISCVILIQLYYTSNALVKTFSGLFILVFSGYTLYFSVKEYASLHRSQSVSDNYLLKAKALVGSLAKHERAAFFYNQADADTLISNRSKNYLYHLNYLGLDAVPLRMSIPQVRHTSKLPLVQADYDRLLEHELYYNFYKKQNSKGSNQDSLELDFLRTHQIRYLVLSPTVEQPHYLNSQNSVVISDPKTGIRFVKLDL